MKILILKKWMVLLTFLIVSCGAWAQQGNALNNENLGVIHQTQSQLGQILNSDGTISKSTNATGSFDVSGYEMTYGENGEPLFFPKRGDSKAAGDENWSSEFPSIPGANGYVYAVVTDASNNIYIAGDFTQVNSVSVNNIAKWNKSTSSWSALGTGMNTYVYALAIDGSGNLYAGGDFTSAGGVANTQFIAKWNGSAWSALGTGVSGTVRALVYDGNGNVYAGGRFEIAGGIFTSRIAKWNGSTWSKLNDDYVNDWVFALAIDGSGNLYAGGTFTSIGGMEVNCIAKWNGSAWSALGTGMDNGVLAVATDASGNVYAGGNFTYAGGVANTKHVAKWNGTEWAALGTGITGNSVNAILNDGSGNIYVGGDFSKAGGVANTKKIAKWNGSAWSALGTGINEADWKGVYSLAIDRRGYIITGGNFLIAGELPASNVAKWDGSAWSSFGQGLNARVIAVAIDGNGNVYAGGEFTTAGGLAANRIAKWNGSEWTVLGTGLNNTVNALAIDGSGNVYAGGMFTSAGGVAVNYIAQWNGSAWAELGTGTNNYVYAIAIDGSENVYAGGMFSSAGGNTVNCISKWNGSEWSALATGVNDAVKAIAIDGGNVYVGGDFTWASGVANTNHIAKWNGSAWSALGTGVNDNVYAIAIHVGNVYAGGAFTTIYGGVTVNHIAKWNGTTWSALESGMDDNVNSIATDGSGNVFAGGLFTTASGVTAYHIAKWNGLAWTNLGSGTNYFIWAINTYNNATTYKKFVYCGGEFQYAGDKSSTYLGKYTDALTFIWDGSESSVWNTDGNWNLNAVPTAYDNVVIANAGIAPIITPTIQASCSDLTVNTGASLTINSDASLITYGNITNLGTINIKRDITEESWHLVSIPTVQANANVFLGDYLQGYNESTALWSEIIPAVTQLAPVHGYALWATPGKSDFTYTFTGTPNTGNQSLSFTAARQYGWNLMGNPYPSYLDWDAVIASQTNMNSAVYFYTGSTYVSYNNGVGSGSRYIAPMQGFFISATNSGTFNLTNNHLTHTSGTFFKEKEIPDHYLHLTTNGNSITDELHIRFNESATPDFDGQFDAWKLLSWNEQAPQLYSLSGNDNLSIDQRPACEMMQLGFFAATAGFYSIAVNEMTDITSATLEDTKTNTFHDLSKGQYEFIWALTDNEKRFKLHLNSVGIEETPNCKSNILIYAANNQIFIKGAEIGEVIVSDVLGRIIVNEQIAGSGLITVPVKHEMGIYFVTVKSNGEVKTEKVFIR